MSLHVRVLFLGLALFFGGFSAKANPFLSGESAESSAPVLRAPTSAGPAISLQLDLREASVRAVRAFADDPSLGTLFLLLGSAFLYGVLHAAGPGHRKTVVFSLFLGRKAAVWEPLAAGFLAAGVHAATGIAIVLGLSVLRGAVARLSDTERLGIYFDASTFAIMGLLALVLLLLKLLRMKSGRGCKDGPRSEKRLYGMVALTSLVPCPGATMLLLFSMYADLLWLGAAGVLAMSVGMGTVISAAGYLAYGGRRGLFSRLKSREGLVGRISDALELFSYAIVLGFALFSLGPLFENMRL